MKQEIIEKISKYFKLTNYEAEKIYEDIFSGIIKGVREDNIASISNLGEFIIKFNSGEMQQSKTVEFLPISSLEEEINQRSFEESRTFDPLEYFAPAAETESEFAPAGNISTENPEKELTADSEERSNESDSGIIDEHPEVKLYEDKPAVEKMYTENSIEEDRSAVEDDIRKKRENILSKIIKPKEEDHNVPEIPEHEESAVFPKVTAPVFLSSEESNLSKEETISNSSGTIDETTSILNEEIKNTAKENEELNPVSEHRASSFSDFFTEINEKGKTVPGKYDNIVPPPESVIPPVAVELHNQITGDQSRNLNFQAPLGEPVLKNGDGAGLGIINGEGMENKPGDNSYYIWYKDSEPNTNDTQTMSYEYELLYQATKEAEYKSKLRIYVTTFILFFSVVLVLLIFSPVIYKYFFTPRETDQTTEDVQNDAGIINETNTSSIENQASVNSLQNESQNTSGVTTPTGTNEQGKTDSAGQNQSGQQPKQEQLKHEEQKNQQPVEQSTVAGVSKNSAGWKDDVTGIIYIQLENGKFAFQESSWDSDAKANQRLNKVGSIITGLKGSVVKIDLGAIGIWYRTLVGEFATLKEAKDKADELRSKEKK